MDSYMTVEQRANQMTDESLESTRRMLQMAEESKQTAANTMVMLDHQGEQLRHVEDVTEKIAKDMTQAEKNLKELTKWKLKWRFKQWFKRVWGSGEDESGNSASAVEGGRGGTMSSKLPVGAPNKQSTRVNLSSLAGPYIERITNDTREDQMEENLAAVGSIMGNLRNMAIDMGSEIDKQNEQIDHITSRVDTNKVCIDRVHQKAKNLIR